MGTFSGSPDTQLVIHYDPNIVRPSLVYSLCVRNLLRLKGQSPGLNLGGRGYLTKEVTGVCGKPLNTLYPVA